MPYVYSTLTADNGYLNYVPGPADIKIPEGQPIVIKGGTGLANDRLVTPLGVATQVTDDELSYLLRNPVFVGHEKAGFIVVSDAKTDPEKVAADMKLRDRSSPVVPADYADAADGTAKPKED